MKQGAEKKVLNYLGSDKKLLQLSAFITDPETKALLEDSLARLKFRSIEVVIGDAKAAAKKYKKITSPELLIVDISGSDLPLNDLQELANVCALDIRVIVFGDRDNVGLYRNLVSQGVSEYLVKPVPADLLFRTLEAMQVSGASHRQDARVGKTVGIFGACGGVGSTSILGILARYLSEEMHRKTVSLDLHLHRGDLGLWLGQRPNKGLAELLCSPERMDGLFIERAATSISPRLDFLGANEEWDADLDVSAAALHDLTEQLQRRYHFVLFDIMAHPLPQALQALKDMDVRLLLLSPSLAALRNMRRILISLEREPSNSQIIVVLNHSRPALKSDIGREKIEEFIGRSIDFEIPYDSGGLSAKVFSFIFANGEKRKAVFALRKLAWSLVGQKQDKKSRSFLNKLIFGGRDVW